MKELGWLLFRTIRRFNFCATFRPQVTGPGSNVIAIIRIVPNIRSTAEATYCRVASAEQLHSTSDTRTERPTVIKKRAILTSKWLSFVEVAP